MSVLEGIAAVAVIVQFLKKIFKLEGPYAVILVVIACIGVTAYKGILEGFGFSLILFFIQVLVGSMGGYELIKAARPKI